MKHGEMRRTSQQLTSIIDSGTITEQSQVLIVRHAVEYLRNAADEVEHIRIKLVECNERLTEARQTAKAIGDNLEATERAARAQIDELKAELDQRAEWISHLIATVRKDEAGPYLGPLAGVYRWFSGRLTNRR